MQQRPRMIGRWDEIKDSVVDAVRHASTKEEAVSRVARLYGQPVTWLALYRKWEYWRKDGIVTASITRYIGTALAGVDPIPMPIQVDEDIQIDIDVEEPPPKKPAHEKFKALVDATRKGPIAFDALCNKLDLSPARATALINEAVESGIQIKVANNHVGLEAPEQDDRVKDLGIPPTVGKRQTVAVISDTHLGSKFCNRAALKDFIQYAHSIGVREVLHPGDVVDGCYQHGMFELTHVGLEDQTQDLFETLPELPGLTYHGITGNHDDTFADKIGIDPGGYIQNYFESRGRRDVKFYGRRGAYLRLRGATVHLWHPRSGGAYSSSYNLQKMIEKYPPGHKPDILLAGHWHRFCYIVERGVHAISCPTFQNPGSAFGKSLGGAPAVGGMVISWALTAHGTLRRFGLELTSHYEREQVRRIHTEDDPDEA